MKRSGLAAKNDYDPLALPRNHEELSWLRGDNERPSSAIPGPVPEDLVGARTESMGEKLLMKMGWRPGKGIAKSRKHQKGEGFFCPLFNLLAITQTP